MFSFNNTDKMGKKFEIPYNTSEMVTITSSKKIEEPDMLLNKPGYGDRDTSERNNLNKPPRHFGRHSPKNLRQPVPCSAEDVSTSSPSTTTTLTTSSNHDSDVVIDGLEENPRWSHSAKDEDKCHHHAETPLKHGTKCWTRRLSTNFSRKSEHSHSPCGCSFTKRQLLLVLVVSIAMVISLVICLVILGRNQRDSASNSDSSSVSVDRFSDVSHAAKSYSSEVENYDEDEENYDYGSQNSIEASVPRNDFNLKEASRLSWDLLNNNQDRMNRKEKGSTASDIDTEDDDTDFSSIVPSFSKISGEKEVVLPSRMIFTSGSDLNPQNSSKQKKRSCCRTQKYAQVIKRENCQPVTITNRMCFGQCVSVWVPGLFASFPVCRPSRSSWKTVTLTCGPNGDLKRRVKVEKVRRCSCMEMESSGSTIAPR